MTHIIVVEVWTLLLIILSKKSSFDIKNIILPATIPIKFKFINILIDEQAAARIHRPEQIENVAIYRLITSETVEEWIYQRQVYKHNVAQHVLTDNHNDQRNLL